MQKQMKSRERQYILTTETQRAQRNTGVIIAQKFLFDGLSFQTFVDEDSELQDGRWLVIRGSRQERGVQMYASMVITNKVSSTKPND